jgi:hypothetical protein
MSHGPEEHIEHGEHAIHAAHNPFDRRVAMTIAIVAAVLACVTMLSHRAHNETILRQAESNRLQTEANILHTKASDQWNYYQSKNLLNRIYVSERLMMGGLAKDPVKTKEQEEVQQLWADEIDKYQDRLPKMKEKAEGLDEEAKEKQKEAVAVMKESEEAHHRADRFDWGELAVELAVVLCSVAVLTKLAGFWYSGIVMGIIGACVALSAFILH